MKAFSSQTVGDAVSASNATPGGRLIQIDALRGVAVLGILVMNIQAMAWIDAAYINPTVLEPLTPHEWGLWLLGRLFADGKFIAIFSLLFGVGAVLQSESLERSGRNPTGFWLRRMGWLGLFGLMHGTLIWYGDILFTYAVCGLFVFWLRKLPPQPLLIIATVLLTAPSVTAWQLQNVIDQTPPWALERISAIYWHPASPLATVQIDAYRGDWLQQMVPRLHGVEVMLGYLGPTLNFWKSSALMLIGMALFKLGVFEIGADAEEQKRLQDRLAIWGVTLGLLIAGAGLIQDFRGGWSIAFSLHMGRIPLYWSSVLMALGYVGLFMWLYRRPGFVRLMGPLAAVGRMALSNYILQSLIGFFLFYGSGLGWFGQLRHGALLLIVLIIWLGQILGSVLWLRRFRQGPLEWLWRQLIAWGRTRNQDTGAGGEA